MSTTIDAERLVHNIQRMTAEQRRALADDLDKRDPSILTSGRINGEPLPDAFVSALVTARSGPVRVESPSGPFGRMYEINKGQTDSD